LSPTRGKTFVQFGKNAKVHISRDAFRRTAIVLGPTCTLRLVPWRQRIHFIYLFIYLFINNNEFAVLLIQSACRQCRQSEDTG